jgi:cysteine-rich repeat protein
MASIKLSRLALLPIVLVACSFEAGGLGGSGGDSDSGGSSSTSNGSTSVNPTTVDPTGTTTDPSGTSSTSNSTDATTDPVTTTDPGTTTTGTTTTDPSSTTDVAGVCGDGTVDVGEQCDAGAMNGDDQACTADCKTNVCGDDKQGPGEGCDDGNMVDGDGCSAMCAAEGCGDKVMQANEECDDGNQTNDDGCTNACTKPKCGDKIVQMGEQCDDGAESAGCDADCSNATCGDGTLNMTAGEVCDDKNMSNTDACAACKPAKCGDGFVQANVEACDDGNNVDNDACTNACTATASLRIFVSSAVYNGNMGGLGGADMKCKTLAMAAGLGSNWMAWLADGLSGPSGRFMTKGGNTPYVRIDGKQVASSWADLTDLTLMNAVDITEKNQMAAESTHVWTNTNPNGSVDDFNNNCGGWFLSNGNANGNNGLRTAVDAKWSKEGTDGCNVANHIYCVEQ